MLIKWNSPLQMHCLVNNSIMTFALELIWHAFRYQFIRSIQNRNDKLQVQQLYTAGIPLFAMNVSPKNKMAASHVVQIHTHARFPRSKKMADLACSRTNRKRPSFATKHFQRKSLKIFDLHPPLRRLVSFVARIITCKVRCWVTDTQTKYCNPRCACAPRVN